MGISKKVKWEENDNGCFIVTSHKTNPSSKYPWFTFQGKRRQMSRYFYEEYFGEIPKGKVIMHMCDNPACINPEHLKAGTQRDNLRDMWRKGRANQKIGEEAGRAKLTEDQVIEIRNRHKQGESTRQLAKSYNLGKSTVWAAITGENWAHVQ